MKFLVRLLINAAALWVAANLVSGITYEGNLVGLLLVALVFGIVNAIVRPILTLLTCPLLILTLGLFTLVLNAILLLITSYLSGMFGLGFHVSGLWPAFVGALVVSIVSVMLSIFAGENRKRD
jgi:putative membrane protein